MLEPEKDTHKCLISSPARFVGEYKEKDELLITIVFPINDTTALHNQLYENPYSRSYYACVFKLDEKENAASAFRMIPNYSYFGDSICICLSVYYGKCFNNHGLMETHGIFTLPMINNTSPIAQYFCGPIITKQEKIWKLDWILVK